MKYLSLILTFSFIGSYAVAADNCDKRQKQEEANLKEFDELDFNVFSKHNWEDFKHTHSKDIVVHFPDGHKTQGLEQHIKDMEMMEAALPDIRITAHPIKIAEGEYTAVQGVMEGTFTKPMKLPDGRVVQPTGKKLKLTMATIGRWKDGVMVEEFLYWDNAAYMSQL